MEEKTFDLEQAKCPSCGGPLEQGYLHGHWWRIRWSPKKRKFWAFTGEPVGKGGLWAAPSVKAARCTRCGIGLFSCDE